jgi:type IV pilus assembly protein PilC
MLTSGVPVVRALEVASAVSGNAVYENILAEAAKEVQSGSTISAAFARHEEMPSILVQIIRIGEETGEVGSILKTLSDFYHRDVNDVIDSVISLIEPIIIVLLGGSVGIVLASVLIPIYNISTSI